jgi:Uma2 family endonuclease
MFAKERQHYTPAEYFALEEQAETKSEYHQGEIVAQAGATINHNRIALNVANAIINALAGTPCETFMADLRVVSLFRPRAEEILRPTASE